MKKSFSKILAVVLMLALALAMSACKKETGPEPDEGQTGIANPWHTAETAEEAAEGAGIGSFTVPEGSEISLGTVEAEAYRYMDGMAEADIPIAAVEMTIRKGKTETEMAEGDISGDYNEYKYDWKTTVGDIEVRSFGNRDGEATKSIWSADGMDYAILANGAGGDDDFGLSEDDLKALVAGTK